MQMKLYTFFFGIVHNLGNFRFGKCLCGKDCILCVAVVFDLTFDDDYIALFDLVQTFGFFDILKYFYRNGACIIGYAVIYNGIFAVLGGFAFHIEDFAPYDGYS